MVYTHSGKAILWGGVIRKVVIPLFTSPLIGFLIGYVFMKIVFIVFANWSQNKVNKTFLKAQIFSSALVAYSHGNNDAQKTMGIITLALISGGFLDASSGVPLWVKVACAATMALGTFTGGKRIMKTMGGGMAEITYKDSGKNNAVYRISKGNEDNSGDYTDYGSTVKTDIDGSTVTLKGDDGTFALGIWNEGKLSYSIALSKGINKAGWQKMIESIR